MNKATLDDIMAVLTLGLFALLVLSVSGLSTLIVLQFTGFMFLLIKILNKK